MDVYYEITFIAAAMGLFEFLLKGVRPWEKLPGWAKGWPWHCLWFVLYTVFVVAIVYRFGNWKYSIIIALWINEDAFYYLLQSIYRRRLMYNIWIELWPSWKSYWGTVVAINIIMIISLGAI